MSLDTIPSLPATPPEVRVVTLENGLEIIIKEDHAAPVVSAQAWCRTGSIHEERWQGAGLSHVLEHMLFKGTTTRPGARIDQEVQDAGGYMNAYTSFDRTVYWINVPNTGAETAIDILSDIMQHATLPAEELAKELDVIRREMDMNHDDPRRRSSRRLFETAYTRSPYRFTIIGYPDIFNELKPEDITAYYKSRYVPNNMFFVVVGDIYADDVVARLVKNFTGSRARPLTPVLIHSEPRQTAPREIIEEATIQLGHLHMSWHIPDVRHEDIPPLDLLAMILGNGRSSRLFQDLREKRHLVNSADAWTYNPGYPGLFGLSAVVDPEDYAAARNALLEHIESVRRDLVSVEELAKVIKQYTASTLAIRRTMQGQAQDLGGNWLAANDLNFSERFLRAVKQVTPEDIRRVANLYLDSENRTVYALLPKGSAPRVSSTDSRHLDSPIQKVELSGGLRLLLKEDHRLPFVEFRMVFRGGVLAETPQTSGLTQIFSKMLLQGTTTRSAEELATEIESLGGSLDSFGGNNSLGLQAELLSSDFEKGLELLSDVVLNPAFPSAALDREREVQLAGIRSQRDHMLQSASKAMRRALFGPLAYGLDPLGSEESLERIDVPALEAFHEKLIAPDNCVLSVFGDVQADAARNAIEKAFKKWNRPSKLPAEPVAITPREIQRVRETRDKVQAVLVLGFRGVELSNPDRFALELLQEACSDLGSRLFLRIREELGLAYYVGAQNFVGLIPGYFAFYAGTAPDKLGLVETEFLREAELLAAEGLTAEELRRAKSKVIGQKKIARQDLGGVALTTALDELYGLGYGNFDREDSYYEKVTLEDIRRVATQYLRRDACVIATAAPE
jgi:zinc protease